MTYQRRPMDISEPIDLDRVVWDPEYRAEIRVRLANDNEPHPPVSCVSDAIQSR